MSRADRIVRRNAWRLNAGKHTRRSWDAWNRGIKGELREHARLSRRVAEMEPGAAVVFAPPLIYSDDKPTVRDRIARVIRVLGTLTLVLLAACIEPEDPPVVVGVDAAPPPCIDVATCMDRYVRVEECKQLCSALGLVCPDRSGTECVAECERYEHGQFSQTSELTSSWATSSFPSPLTIIFLVFLQRG